jgi:hypothetical protein
MLKTGVLRWGQLEKDIELGYFRPSLVRDIKYRHLIPSWLHSLFDKQNTAIDRLSNFVPHKAVYDAKRLRQKAIKEYEAKLVAVAERQKQA